MELGATTNDGSQVIIDSGSFVDSLGSYSVFYDSVDAYGNDAIQVVRTVNVVGPIPTLTIPDDITIEATAQFTTVDIGVATATDDIDPNPTIINNSTSTFPVGITAILWTATNSIGNHDTAIQTITVTDTTPPTLIIPNGITAKAIGEHTIVNIGTVTVIDNSDTNPTVTNNAPSSFLFGVTYVTWTVDALGNIASSIQTVTIVDTTPPHLTVPDDVTLEYTGQPVTSSIGTATANDLVDSDVTITNDAPNSFLLGTYTITWTATDDSGNQSIGTQTITVQDTTPPIITAPDDMTVEVTGQTTAISIGTATATDSVDASPTITNNATNSFPVGNTIILWTATDDSGNHSTATQTITVYGGAVIVEDAATPNPLVKMNEFFENIGGLFFGLGIFTIFFLFIGFMTSPKTVHIYTIIIMIFAGILNAMGVFAFPAWMWGVMIFIAIVLVFQRRRS